MRCINCKNAQCIKGCPVAINIPAFIRFDSPSQPQNALTFHVVAKEIANVESLGVKIEKNVIVGKSDCHVSAADNRNLLAAHNRRIRILVKRLHQVASCQILVCGKYTVGLLAWNPHKFRKPCTGADK